MDSFAVPGTMVGDVARRRLLGVLFSLSAAGALVGCGGGGGAPAPLPPRRPLRRHRRQRRSRRS
jgi:hypothetical protein